MPQTGSNLLKVTRLAPVALAAALAFTGIAHAGLINPTPANAGLPPINMTENGGPVMTGAVQTFAIYYGNFAPSDAGHPITSQQVVANWLSALNGTTYLNIASTFTGAPNGTVSTDVTYGGAYDVPTNYLGNNLSNANILQIVHDAESSSALPTNSNAVYFVFTAPGISQQQDATACGWHGGNLATHTIYSWVGPALGCDFLGGISGSPVGDEFTETGSHELFESLTDPYPNSAYTDLTPGTGEVGDVCTNSNFSVNLNGDQADLQSIWTLVPNGSPTGGSCSLGVTFSTTGGTPEPTTPLLIGSGLLAAGIAARKRRKNA
jgi:hypothetical protein